MVNLSVFSVSHFSATLLLLGVSLFFGNLSILAQGFAPDEAVQKMTVADGFKVDLVASEPMIAQPVCIEFDDRGRLWVIQYLQYPNPAGLSRAKVDRYSRTIYNKVPEPPPRGPKGADRITILSDFNANGRAQKAKDFVGGLNLASGLAFGHGGVFVLQVPYLLFYPDRNRDDVPDAEPEVLLTGFGMEDAHSVANSLTFGPDGWLYGCQGSTVTANIRGIEFQQGVWRYHPVSKRFELFCEGGGNSWGLDFDEDGNLIYSTNLGPNRMLHGVQGGYYWKSFGKHGALHNPYAYGYFDHVPYANFVGGHVTDGGIIYQGDSFPEKFRGKYIANDLLGHTVQWHSMEKWGSTFKAGYGGELLVPNDTWFAPCDLTMGPDGAIYVADWHDKRTAHPDPDAEWDRSNGRIYRISFGGTRSASPASLPEDLTKLSSEKLVDLLSSKNNWFVRKARNILADRRDVTIYPKLRGQIFETADRQLALESLWTLYVSGGCDEAFLNDLLEHQSWQIRNWAVRFLGDEMEISSTSTEHLAKLARSEESVSVRGQLASTAKRLPARAGLTIAHEIARRNLDADDPYVPLLLWWAVEKVSITAIDEVLNLFGNAQARESTLIRNTILPRLIRRYAAEGSPAAWSACARLIESAPSATEKRTMLFSFNQGLGERATSTPIRSLPAALSRQLTELWNDDTTDAVLIGLLARLHDEKAKNRAVLLLAGSQTPTELRIAMLGVIGSLADPSTTPTLLALIKKVEPTPVQLAALDALRQIPNAPAGKILMEYPAASAAVREKIRDAMFSRKEWAREFLAQVDSGKFPPGEVALDQLQKISSFNDPRLNELVRKHWGNIGGGTPEEKLADIRRFNNDLRAFPGNAKNGRVVFQRICASCHELFGEGEKVGPELTYANRKDKDFLLTSIVDPNSVIRKEFINYTIETRDGRVLNGLMAEQSPNRITIVAAKNERTTLNREMIGSVQESSLSLMPEGLMHGLTPEERRDLFAYLQSEKPLALHPTK